MSITILMMILLSSIFGITNTNQIKYGITTTRVNLRKNTSLDNSSIIKTLNANENLKIINDINDFYIVQLINNEFGLISKKYVKIQEIDKSQFQNFEFLDTFTTIIKSNNTNIRSGPGTNFSIITKLPSSSSIEVIGKSQDWYLIKTLDNFVGLVRSDLIEIPSSKDNLQNTDSDILPNTAETILSLINLERKNQGIHELKIDSLLNTTASIKAKDMVTNNYFSHTSPTYGSPFEMMQKSGITYKTAGENIAGNQSVQKAVEAWISSNTHKQNILSTAYNYIGIGLEKSDTYGYVIVVMFIGK